MFFLLSEFYRNLKELDNNYRDQRTLHYPLLGNPLQIFVVLSFYYAFVRYLGPKLMQNRAPFELRNTLLLYNLLQIICCSILGFYMLYKLFTLRRYTYLSCTQYDPSNVGSEELRIGYSYLLLKLADLLDTVFYVLRKHHNQITFLHVYHHIMVSLSTFVFMRYVPSGQFALVLLLNNFVHAVMYFYYFVSALRPGLRGSIWWKKYITQLQLVQFVIVHGHSVNSLLNADCKYPTVISCFIMIQSGLMIVIFGDFYYRTYIKREQSETRKVK